MKRSRETLRDDRAKNNRNHPTMAFPERLVYVEFYAGVGGWTYALEQALENMSSSEHQHKPSLVCAAALDHSDLCLAVYQHNHHDVTSKASPDEKDATSKSSKVNKPNTPRKKKETTAPVRIEHMTLEQLIGFQANIFLMSPPCQPHSRQHSNQEADLQDPRSRSFLHLCDLLEQMPKESLPQAILLENVVGFESSNSCQRWRRVLAARNYRVGHFHLQPTQVGLPNDRPRYYTVAVHDVSSEAVQCLDKYLKQEDFSSADCNTPRRSSPELVLHTELPELEIVPLDSNSNDLPSIQELLNLNDSLHSDDAKQEQLRLPDKILASNAAWCMDLVTPKDCRSACFTSSYGKYCRGTGSVLYTGNKPITLSQPEDREFVPDWADGIELKTDLRYFSGLEMARFFGFPSRFSFPKSVTLKQQWKLMGNSLNARVAGRLVELALRAIYKLSPNS